MPMGLPPRDPAADDRVDLRTDFVSRPTPAMIEAMTEAAGRPMGFGLRDDPVQLALEARTAEILGTEDALLCPTCAMANQVALHVYGRPGDNFVSEATSHVITSESGAPAALSGLMARPVPGVRGVPEPADIAAAIQAGDPQRTRTCVVVIENTHVRTGGTVMAEERMAAIRAVAKAHGLPVHLDGSRIFNAAVALGRPARDLARHADSIAFSLNKGLGAPLGAMLAGPRDFIAEAVRVRQMFGGGWRPAGIPAAAGLVALQHGIDRLAEDHRRAKALAGLLAGIDGLAIDDAQVQTNIVLVRVTRPGLTVDGLPARVGRHGVLGIPFGPDLIRLVTYHNITDADVERAAAAFRAGLAD